MCVLTYSSGSMGFSAREENAIESTLPLAKCTLTLPLPPLPPPLPSAALSDADAYADSATPPPPETREGSKLPVAYDSCR